MSCEETGSCYVEALYDFQAVENGGLSFVQGDLLKVISKLPSGWWDGIHLASTKRGWFPSNYCKECSAPAAEQNLPLSDRNRNSMTSSAVTEKEEVPLSPTSDQLPENWGIKTNPNGKQYSNNQHEEKAPPNDPKDMLNNLLKEIEEQELNDEDVEEKELPPSPNEELDDDSLVFTWTGVSINVTTKLAALAQCVNERDKESYVPAITATVMAIHIMLHSSDMSSKESQILNLRPFLRSAHSKILSLTATLIMQSKSASNAWPSPDAEKELQITVGHLANAVREFSQEASRLDLPIKTLSTEELFKVSKQSGVAAKKIVMVPKFKVDPALVFELENKLVDISTTYSSFNITHEGQRGISSSPLTRAELVKSIQVLVKLVNEYLASADLLPFSQDEYDESDMLLEFKVVRMSLLNGITDLVASVRRVVKERGSVEAVHATLVAVESVVESANELLVSTKFLLEEKENVEPVKLQEIITATTAKRGIPSIISSASSAHLHSPVIDRVKTSSLKGDIRYDSVGPFSPSHGHDAASSRHMSMDSEVGDAWFLNQPEYSLKEVFIVDGQLKGASIYAYICKLTSNTETDDAFTTVFLSSYRTITSTTKFIPMLLDRFSISPPEGLQGSEKVQWTDKKLKKIRFKVYNVLKSWLDRYIQDGKEDRAALDTIDVFAKSIMSKHMDVSAAKIIQMVEAKKSGGIKASNTSMSGLFEDIPDSILPKSGTKIRLTDLDPVEFARQITLYESELVQNIIPSELLTTVWTSYATKNISIMILHSKHLSAWVSFSILQSSSTDPKKRAKAILFFISTAQELIKLCNFNSLSCILQALDSKPIKRLTQSWAYLTSKQTVTYKKLHQISSSKLFSEYRANRPSNSCVPLFPVVLNNFEAVKKNTPTRVQESLYNYEKLKKISDLLKEFKGLQKMYQLHIVDSIRKFLVDEMQRHSYTENELSELSIHVEPVPSPKIEKKIENLLGNTGF